MMNMITGVSLSESHISTHNSVHVCSGRMHHQHTANVLAYLQQQLVCCKLQQHTDMAQKPHQYI